MDRLFESEHGISAAAGSARALASRRQSYSAALESYNYGLRNLLDVTAAQRTLAQARSTDVLARTQVLTALADLAFRTGDSIQPSNEVSTMPGDGNSKICVLSSLSALPLTGCGRAPSVDVLGSFFPGLAHLFSAGVLFTALGRFVLLRFHMNLDLPVILSEPRCLFHICTVADFLSLGQEEQDYDR